MAEAPLRVSVLGPLVVERNGRPLPITSGRQRSLLALLVLAGGEPLSRDRLVDELWGEQAPATAVSALHVYLSKLRALLGDVLELTSGGYALARDAYELDVRRFEALVDQARTEPARAETLLSEALELFRGEPLCDIACEGTVAHQRRAIEERRLNAIIARTDAALARGAADELVPELETLAAAHPFEERLWGQLMLALYGAGRQADALEAYRRIRLQLTQELGLDPGEPLTRLQQQILDRDPALLVGAAAAPAVETPDAHVGVPSNVPRAVTRLIGRERELLKLAGLAADPDVRLITLRGPGGVGKTRLALELAARLESEYTDGALFVRLERLTDPALVSGEIATALAQRDGVKGSGADGLLEQLRNRQLLLVVDNFEHLLAAAPLVSELLAAAPQLRVIVASRTHLRVRGEHRVEVEPLPLPAGDDAGAIAASPAVQLFLQSALASDPALQIDDPLTRIVGSICTALDGLPLAIELAASRVEFLSVPEIAGQLARPLAIGDHALRDLPDRQQTLHDTISWSYELLTPAAAEVLRSSAVFLGGFTAAALDAVAGRPARAELTELLEASLVRRQGSGGRYELLELVRAFALEELASVALEAEARLRHRCHYAAIAAPVGATFDGGQGVGELAATIDADHANLLAALGDAIDAGDGETAITLAVGLRALWFTLRLRQECHDAVGRILAELEVPISQELVLLRCASFLESSEGLQPGSYTRLLATRAAEAGDRSSLAVATSNLMSHAGNARDVGEIMRLKPTLIELVETEPDPLDRGWLHYGIALAAYVGGELDEAAAHARSCAQDAELAGHAHLTAIAAEVGLFTELARTGAIAQPALVETIELIRRSSSQTLFVVGLWFVARFATTFDRPSAMSWLADAERIYAQLDTVIWPECVIRDDAMTALGIEDIGALVSNLPPPDSADALAEAAVWLQTLPDASREGRARARP